MSAPPTPPDELERMCALFHEHGGNISGAARAAGLDRGTYRSRLDRAAEVGLLAPRPRSPNEAGHRPFEDIVRSRKEEFQRRRVKGTWRKPYLVHMGRCEPILLTILGDPHLDNPGTDLETWEWWTAFLDASAGSYGACIGDWLDNWLRVLGFLYGESTTTRDEAWELFEGYARRMAPHMLGSVGGNHDKWESGDALIERVFRELKVRHKPHGLRLALMFEGRADPIFVGLRHHFKGQSQWNPVHAITKAAQLGIRDHILAAGHIHKSGDGRVVCPDTGLVTFCAQIAAFKMLDTYADEQGFLNGHISPAISLLIDPRRGDSDPEMIHPYYCPEAARDALDNLRCRS